MAESDQLKVPPHDLAAEKSVLGSLLLDRDAIVKVADILVAEDFYFENNGLIYKAISSLFHKRRPVDLLTLASYLKDCKQLDLVGGESYLAELTEAVPTATHVVQYALIVKHKSILRKLLKAGQEITALSFNEAAEAEELLEKAEKSIFNVSQNFIRDRFVHIKEILELTYEKISDLHDADEKHKYRGIPTSFHSLDRILSGFQSSDLIIIAARPAMGKTSLALNIAQNVAKLGKTVGIISLEMSKEQLVERLFCSLLAVDSWKLRTGNLNDDDFSRIGSVMDELNQHKIYIDDSVGNSISELRAKTRRLQMEHGLDMLFVDYLQLMSTDKSSFSGVNRVQEISEISRALKILAKELRIPIVALSQLSRAVEQRPSKIPQLADLRESGAIEQDADMVLMMYREDYYEEDTERAGVTDIFVRKHRNGPTGRIELMFKKEQMRFYDIDVAHKVAEAMPLIPVEG